MSDQPEIIHLHDDVPQPTGQMLCWKPQPLDQGMARCDRKAGHGGKHTWELLDPADDDEIGRRGMVIVTREAYTAMRAEYDVLREIKRRIDKTLAGPKEDAK